jgi:hypothetical protein
MDYSVGSRVRVRLYSGRVVIANIASIHVYAAGPKIHIVYGDVIAVVNSDQIIEVLK